MTLKKKEEKKEEKVVEKFKILETSSGKCFHFVRGFHYHPFNLASNSPFLTYHLPLPNIARHSRRTSTTLWRTILFIALSVSNHGNSGRSESIESNQIEL